jgi:hypothetical protein
MFTAESIINHCHNNKLIRSCAENYVDLHSNPIPLVKPVALVSDQLVEDITKILKAVTTQVNLNNQVTEFFDYVKVASPPVPDSVKTNYSTVLFLKKEEQLDFAVKEAMKHMYQKDYNLDKVCDEVLNAVNQEFKC